MSFKDGGYWPFLIVGLLVGGVVMNLAMVMTAADDPSFSIEENYYQKAIDWDAHREELRASKALGWTLNVNPTLGTDAMTVRANLQDAFGRDIPDATVKVIALHVARANERLTAFMDRDREGFYATFPASRPGAWELKFEAIRGTDRFLHTERAELAR